MIAKCTVILIVAIMMTSTIVLQLQSRNEGNDVKVEIEAFPDRTLTHPFYYCSGNYLAYKAVGVPDSQGVLRVWYSGDLVYSPLEIARYAAEIYTYWYVTNDSTPLNEFRAQIDWLRSNETIFGDHSVWLYEFNVSERASNPWFSSIANSFVIAAFIESYAIDGDAQDLQRAWRGLKAYRSPMIDHGLLSMWNGTVWYEEEGNNISSVVNDPSHILNGFLFALGAPLYIHDFNGSAYAKSIFDDGVASLKVHMEIFDSGMWQEYSLKNNRIYNSYMDIHEMLLNWLASEVNDAEISAWANRTSWMHELPASGMSIPKITASSTIDPINHSVARLVDKQIYNTWYWSGWNPASLTFDLGSVRSINFFGYYGPWIKNAPRNWTLYSSDDNSTWAKRATVIDSIEYDKCIVFDPGIQVRYLKMSVSSVCNSSIIALDEVVIANFPDANKSEATTSITDHRFAHVDGRLNVTAPNGTVASIDNGPSATITNLTASYWLSNGLHIIHLSNYGVWVNWTLPIVFAQTVYFNTTSETFVEDTPVAIAGPNRTAVWNTTVTFDGSTSHDNQGIANYTWNISDSAILVKYGPIVTHAFQHLGNHTITLRVRDGGGHESNNTIWVEVVPDAPPVAMAGPDQTVDDGEKIYLNGSQSMDDVGIVEYSWFVSELNISIFGERVELSILRPGTYHMVLTVKDTNGSSSSDSCVVTVIDTTPSISPTDYWMIAAVIIMAVGAIIILFLIVKMRKYPKRRRSPPEKPQA